METNTPYFSLEQTEAIKAILSRIDPTTINSLQFFIKDNEFRTGCTFVIQDKWKRPVYLFQNFQKLSEYRMKLLKRLSKNIPFEMYITNPREDITRVGWKVEK